MTDAITTTRVVETIKSYLGDGTLKAKAMATAPLSPENQITI